MKQFIRNHDSDLLGVLSGFDRIRFRGTQRWLATERGLMSFLCKPRILLKDFVKYSQRLTKEIRGRLNMLAAESGRPSHFPGSTRTRKEDLARKIAAEDNITDGLIGVLRCVEPCYSYEIGKDLKKQQLKLKRFWTKCTHYDLYFIDPIFGFGHLRLQSWFPFTIHININGREWLCRELDRRRIGYVQRDNCLVAVDDVAQAQQILDEQVTAEWQMLLNRLAVWAFPLHQRLLNGEPMHYYWSADDTEWASDLMFRSPKRLARLYPQLLQHAMTTFSSPDVLRFLGRKVPAHGEVNGHFIGEFSVN